MGAHFPCESTGDGLDLRRPGPGADRHDASTQAPSLSIQSRADVPDWPLQACADVTRQNNERQESTRMEGHSAVLLLLSWPDW